MKRCTKCGEEKDLSAFPCDKTAKSGRKSNCKECAYAMTAAWRGRNPDYQRPQRDYAKEREQQREYRARNKEYWHARWQAYYAANSDNLNRRWRDPVKLLRKEIRRTIERYSGLPRELIPESLLDAKVAQIMAQREIKSLANLQLRAERTVISGACQAR